MWPRVNSLSTLDHLHKRFLFLTSLWNGRESESWPVWNLFPRLIVPLQVHAAAASDVTASEEVKRPVLAAVGCLKLVSQTELPLVLQLQPGDGLP